MVTVVTGVSHMIPIVFGSELTYSNVRIHYLNLQVNKIVKNSKTLNHDYFKTKTDSFQLTGTRDFVI